MSPGVPRTPLETPSHRAVTVGVRVATLACAGTVTPTLILRCLPGVTANLGIRLPCGRVPDWPFTRTVNDGLNGTTPGAAAVGGVLLPFSEIGTTTAMAATASNDPETSPMIRARRRRIRPVSPSTVKRGGLT